MRDTIWLYLDYMGELQAERTDYGLLREPQVENWTTNFPCEN